MCVIVIADTTRPTPELIEQAYCANSHGAGIAWRSENADGNTVVAWRKGLTLDEVQSLAAEVPMPFVAHFRIASAGGVKPALTHPFPIEANTGLDLEGETTGQVLFHNGHWGKWKDEVLAGARAFGTKLPVGPWSDTRGMAFLCSFYGTGYMDFIEEKGVAFGPDTLDIFWGTGWSEVDGVWVSNTHFRNKTRVYNPNDPTGAYSANGVGIYGPAAQVAATTYHKPFCRHERCISKEIDSSGYCAEHRVTAPVSEVVGGASTLLPFPQSTSGNTISPGTISTTMTTALSDLDRQFRAGTLSKKQYRRAKRALKASSSPMTISAS